MRVVVVGGSGRTGSLVVQALRKTGADVVATIRDPRHTAGLLRQGVEVAMIDLETSPLSDIAQAFAGADAVVFAAGSAEGELSSAIDRKGVKRTLLAAARAGVRRYVAVSSLGATTARSEAYDWPGMRAYFTAKRAANALVRASGLDWTIVEPGTLADGPASGRIALSEGIDVADAKISRADVAAVVVACLEEPRSAGHTFQLVGGGTALPRDAVRAASSRPPAATDTSA